MTIAIPLIAADGAKSSVTIPSPRIKYLKTAAAYVKAADLFTFVVQRANNLTFYEVGLFMQGNKQANAINSLEYYYYIGI